MVNRKIELIKGDCLEKMKEIKDKSISLICADLPYGSTKCKWDSKISLELLWEQYSRIIKDDGYVLLFAQTPFDKVLGCSNINKLKYEWIWIKDKPTGHLNANYAPMKKHENILVFTNNPTSYTKKCNDNGYNIEHLLTPVNKEITRTNKHGIYDLDKKQSSKQKYTGYPNDVLNFSSDKESYHPTQKPVALLEYLINIYSNEEQVVLDNCMGSGSTGIACLKTNRDFIGIELDDTYFEVSLNRINKYITENKLNNINIQVVK